MYLDKAKKPAKKSFDLSELDEESSGEEITERAGESEGEMGSEPEAAIAPDPMLAEISDDDLMAELKRRGLMGGMESEEDSELMDSGY